ncbi:hypothetical protein WMF38_31270 [Sorangium sp. So ce118]
MESTYTPTHPIIFVFDPSNENMEVPAYDPGRLVSFNDSCVSVRTIADVDGDVTATLAVELPIGTTAGSVEVFRGIIDTPGGIVALITSENKILLDMKVNRSRVPVRLLVDDETHPARILVEILDSNSSAS